MHTLTEQQIADALTKLPHWEREGTWIITTIQFSDFLTAIDFVGAVAEVAEKRKHHPVITVEYDTVTLELTTHDAGSITQKDIDLAHAIELLELDYGSEPEDPGFI